MSSSIDKIRELTRQLYPTGRAFRTPQGGIKDRLHKSLAEVENNAYLDANSILDSILPDNDNFTVDDATLWEFRLGMITNTLVPLEDRKAAIIRKMNHPGTVLARQSRDYLQNSLQLAGFNVFVYENTLNQTIEQVLQNNPDLFQLGDGQLGDFQLGDAYSIYGNLFTFVQLGNFQLGDFQLGNSPTYNNKIVNNIIESKDSNFDVGGGYQSSFFIGGPTLGSFADVDVNRKDEFRQLILKIKPVQTVGFLLINYI